MPTTVRSHAKINLGLGIGAPRADGFHSLATVYQTLELHDLVTVSAQRAKVTALRLTSNDRRVPTDARNTAWKMVELALKALEINAEVEIHIEKRLPVQGGLGAGSANAVAALVGIEAELGIAPKWSSLPPYEQNALVGWGTRRLAIAAEVGSDVPLFLIGGTVLGLDRGQEVYPLPDIEAGMVCGRYADGWGFHAAGLSRLGRSVRGRRFDRRQASTDKLNELSRAYASAFAGAIPGGRAGSWLLRCPLRGRGPGRTSRVRACPHRDQ